MIEKSNVSKRQLVELLREKRIRRALKDPYFWLTECTKTKDEQDKTGNPYKPFPQRPYFRPCIEVIENEPVILFEKSRTMMLSWLVSGWCAHYGFNHPATGVVFQSEDEDRAVHCVENVKTLWEQSDPELKERWQLERPLEKQPYFKFELANGSWFKGIPGNPDKIRSDHPTIVVLDEAAFITRGDDSYNNAKATRCLKMICVSSAETGWYEDFTKPALPVDWPEYASQALEVNP